ncbi:MAG: hypothetical protein JOZ02_14390 [Acidobacteria bacterium]|nr:hypothetical protein [Acidobacteriota bacterium]
MNNWMRRRIERSRARCEKATTSHKTDKSQEPEKQAKLAGPSSLESDEKGG